MGGHGRTRSRSIAECPCVGVAAATARGGSHEGDAPTHIGRGGRRGQLRGQRGRDGHGGRGRRRTPERIRRRHLGRIGPRCGVGVRRTGARPRGPVSERPRIAGRARRIRRCRVERHGDPRVRQGRTCARGDSERRALRGNGYPRVCLQRPALRGVVAREGNPDFSAERIRLEVVPILRYDKRATEAGAGEVIVHHGVCVGLIGHVCDPVMAEGRSLVCRDIGNDVRAVVEWIVLGGVVDDHHVPIQRIDGHPGLNVHGRR